jgi:hypothetical protein
VDKFKDLDDKGLADLLVEKQTAATALLDSLGDATPTPEQVTEAQALSAEIDDIATAQAERLSAAAESAEAFAGLRDKVTAAEQTEEEPADEPVDEEEDPEAVEPEVEDVEDVEEEAPVAEVAAASKTKVAATLARRTSRPAPPAVEPEEKGYRITAAPETGFAAGTELATITDISKAAMNRLQGFAPPSGDGQSVNLQKFSVASIKVDYDESQRIDRGTSDDSGYEKMVNVSRESNIPGHGSLTAAGGWCAPSETIYDLPADESLDGILSLPEIGVTRGGIRYTPGPQFSDFYAEAGFAQTEAQAIAGTTKPCYEVDCPTFSEMRLEAIGLCIKVPILTNAAYPELVNRFTSGTLVAHEHWKNARVIGKMVTIAGTARTFTGIGSSVADVMGALELLADERREAYRLPLGRTLEVVVPFWLKGNLRSDLANRNGVGADAISDAQIAAHFSARNLSVQYVYDWQPIGQTSEVYPETVNVLMYPAGTFVKGVSDVINLSAVYDAASLAVNTYTGLFMEQGLLVANLQYSADLVTLPIESVGRTGRTDLGAANA